MEEGRTADNVTEPLPAATRSYRRVSPSEGLSPNNAYSINPISL